MLFLGSRGLLLSLGSPGWLSRLFHLVATLFLNTHSGQQGTPSPACISFPTSSKATGKAQHEQAALNLFWNPSPVRI